MVKKYDSLIKLENKVLLEMSLLKMLDDPNSKMDKIQKHAQDRLNNLRLLGAIKRDGSLVKNIEDVIDYEVGTTISDRELYDSIQKDSHLKDRFNNRLKILKDNLNLYW